LKTKILLEGLSYRFGDFLIGLAITFIFAYYFTHDLDISTEIGSLASLTENILNTLWYWINRTYWTKETSFSWMIKEKMKEVKI